MHVDQIYNQLPVKLRLSVYDAVYYLIKPKIRHLYKKFISKGDLVFDIGANKGVLTDVFVKLGAKVVAVDPQPKCVRELKKRFMGNDKVTIIAKGLGSKCETREFYISTKNHTTSTFSKKFINGSRLKHRKWDKKIKVEMITLDDLIAEYGVPSFCKIDTEGFDWQVIKGLSQPIPVIEFEFHEEFLEDVNKSIQHLDLLGKVEFNYSPYFAYTLIHKKWLSEEKIYKELEMLKHSFVPHVEGDIFARFV